jgi:hypothetical protein
MMQHDSADIANSLWSAMECMYDVLTMSWTMERLDYSHVLHNCSAWILQ